jgi:hypothetical protein
MHEWHNSPGTITMRQYAVCTQQAVKPFELNCGLAIDAACLDKEVGPQLAVQLIFPMDYVCSQFQQSEMNGIYGHNGRLNLRVRVLVTLLSAYVSYRLGLGACLLEPAVALQWRSPCTLFNPHNSE